MKDRLAKLSLWIVKAFVATLIAVVALSIFVLFYQYQGLRIIDEKGATDYKYSSNSLSSNFEEGFSFFRMDGNGYNNTAANTHPDILFMGSSHIEAREVLQNENASFILNSMLNDMDVYNIGMSAHTIYRNVDNFQNAVRNYSPRYVIIETSRIDLNVDLMTSVINGTAKRLNPSGGGISRLVSKIPCIAHMHSQLSTWISSDDVESEADFEISDSYESVLGLFLDEAINEETTTIILYHPYECLLQDGTVRWSQESSIELFKEACCRKGIVFVDMTDDFDCLYCQKNQLPHGFITGRVGKGHINKYGHKAIAERLYAVISELEVR